MSDLPQNLPQMDRWSADLNTALSLLRAYGRHARTCVSRFSPLYDCSCGYAERVTPFLERMIEVKK